MDSLTETLLADIRAHRIPGLELSVESIHPRYGDQSILNVPSSVCELLDVPPLESGALRADILNPLGNDSSDVILILMDALSFHRLQRWLAEDDSLIWNHLADGGVLAPITSVVPSTTCACIPTLWTGVPPARHGITGYEMWLKEYGLVANMIELKPAAYRGGGASLEQAGFVPEDFLLVESISTHLQRHGIATHIFQHYSLVHSGLSEMFVGEAEVHPVSTAASLWASVFDLTAERPSERKYIWVYWGSIDGLSHRYGPDDERNRWEFKLFSDAFEHLFLERLPAAHRGKTTVILTADHGQITTDRQDEHFNLDRQPALMQMLHLKPTGENRLAYLYVRPGCEDSVRRYVEDAWSDQFHVLDPLSMIDDGLFGPGEVHPRLTDRIGDLIVSAQGHAYWWWVDKPNPLVGRHGGLSDEEMIVPFLAARL
jgi:hypothetical protein